MFLREPERGCEHFLNNCEWPLFPHWASFGGGSWLFGRLEDVADEERRVDLLLHGM
jgi:hypothetical protein